MKSHLNGLTYNSRTNRIVASRGSGKKLIIINPSTLRMYTKKVSIPKKLPGASKKQRKKITAFSAVAYDTNRDRYVAITTKYHDFVIISNKFKAVKYVKSKYGKYDTSQSLYIDGNTLYFCFSKKFGLYSNHSKPTDYNYVRKYDAVNLRYIGTVNLPDGHELENIFKAGNTWYAGFYYPHYEFREGEEWVVKKLEFYKKSKKYYERYYNTSTKKSYWSNPVYKLNLDAFQ